MSNPNKIPVMDVVGEAYRFVFANLGPIYLVCALPFAALAAVNLLSFPYLLDLQIADARRGTTLSPGFVGFSAVVNAVQAVFIGTGAVALHRMVLFGQRRPRLSWGAVERKFVVASVVLGLAFSAIALVQGLVFQARPSGVMAGLALAVAVATLILLVYLVFIMQVFPLIVAEGEISLRRAFSLSLGNWWRTLGVVIVASIPASIVMLVVGGIVGNIFGYRVWPDITDPGSLVPFLEGLRENTVPLSLAQFVTNIFATAIGVGVLSYSYKALNGQALEATLTGPPPT